jgi:hypothetical protein
MLNDVQHLGSYSYLVRTPTVVEVGRNHCIDLSRTDGGEQLNVSLDDRNRASEG